MRKWTAKDQKQWERNRKKKERLKRFRATRVQEGDRWRKEKKGAEERERKRQERMAELQQEKDERQKASRLQIGAPPSPAENDRFIDKNQV